MSRIRIFRGSGIFKGFRIFRGSGIIQALSLMLFLLILSSCEHKEFRYVTSSFRSLRVEFNWERYEDFQKPEGMRVIFFPKDGTGEPWIFDFPNGEGRQIELPENEYRVICYNYDTSGIYWENPNSFVEYLARPAAYCARQRQSLHHSLLALWRPHRLGIVGEYSRRHGEGDHPVSGEDGEPIHLRGEWHPESGKSGGYPSESFGDVRITADGGRQIARWSFGESSFRRRDCQ